MLRIAMLLLMLTQNLWAIDSDFITNFIKSDKPQIVRAYYSDKQQIQDLSQFITLWEVNTSQKYTVFQLDSKQDFDKIIKLGFKLRIDTKLQAKVMKDQSNVAVKGQKSIPGYACYSTVEETITRMEAMAANHPNLTEIIDIGDSWEKTVNSNNGYDMLVLKITNENIVDVDKPILFISSAVHAREYATAELNTRFAEYLLENYATNSDVRWMLDHQEVHFLLHNNPDGRKKAEAQVGGSPGWRKNTNQAYCSPNSTSRGADLNRNYPFGWESNPDQCSNTYSGGSAESEPEISSIVGYFNTIWNDNRGIGINDAAPEDTAGVFLDVHSYSQLILWPWGYSNSLSPNQQQFAAFGKRVAYFNDYEPKPAAGLYTAKGTSIDASYGDLGVASLVYELGTAFYQDCAEFENKILPDNLESLLYVSRVTRMPYITPFGPDIEELLIYPNYVLNAGNIFLEGKANDDRYNHSNGTQAVGQVQKVEFFKNQLPWLAANGTALDASDGLFDSANENFSGSINASELNDGENTIYVVATDNETKQGAVFSQFINVVDAAAVGVITGQVTDVVTGAIIENANFEINQSLTKSNEFGNYSQLVHPTTASLNVLAENYAPLQVENITIEAQQTLTQNVQLEPYCEIFGDDVENGEGLWQAQSPWAIFQGQATSGINSWTDSPNQNYANNIDTSLVSAAIDITGSNSIEVAFNHLCDTEAAYDYGHLEVNIDNSNWQEVFSCNGSLAWESERHTINIPNNSQSLQIRFRLTSDSYITEDGWYIDDISIKASGASCHVANSDLIFSNGFE